MTSFSLITVRKITRYMLAAISLASPSVPLQAQSASVAAPDPHFSLALATGWTYLTTDELSAIRTSVKNPEWVKLEQSIKARPRERANAVTGLYTIRFRLDAEAKERLAQHDSLLLILPSFSDEDQIFLNSHLINAGLDRLQKGQKSSLIQCIWISTRAIYWDLENEILLRVRTDGVDHTPLLSTLSRLTSVHFTDFAEGRMMVNQPQGILSVKFSYQNYSSHRFSGTLTWKVFNQEPRLVLQETVPGTLNPGNGVLSLVRSWPTHLPQGIYTIQGTFADSINADSRQWTLLFSTLSAIKLVTRQSKHPKMALSLHENFQNAELTDQDLGPEFTRLSQSNSQNVVRTTDQWRLDSLLLNGSLSEQSAGFMLGAVLQTGLHTWAYTQDTLLKAKLDKQVYLFLYGLEHNSKLCLRESAQTFQPLQVPASPPFPPPPQPLHPILHDPQLEVLMGLILYYQTTGLPQALAAAEKMILAEPHPSTQRSLAYLEPLVKLYALSGNVYFRSLCDQLLSEVKTVNPDQVLYSLIAQALGRKIELHQGIIPPLLPEERELLCQVAIGLNSYYQLNGNTGIRSISEALWATCVPISKPEGIFSKAVSDAPASTSTGSASWNQSASFIKTWLELNQALFVSTGKLEYLNECERFFTEARLQQRQHLTSTLPESVPIALARCTSLIPLTFFGTLNQEPILLFYQPSQARLRIHSTNGGDFFLTAITTRSKLDNAGYTIMIIPGQERSFSLLLRVPPYSKNFRVELGDQMYTASNDSIVRIQRHWTPGDKLEIHYDH